MTAESTDAIDFVEALRATIPALHPITHREVNELLGEARHASHNGNITTVVRLMDAVRTKVACELHWEAELAEHLGDHFTADALRQHADDFDPTARTVLYPPQGEEPMSPAANVPPILTRDEQAPAPAATIQHIVDLQSKASPEHLAKPWQNVTLRNSDPAQAHYVRDRAFQYVKFEPGEQREIAMVVDELQELVRLARTDRGHYESGPRRGLPFPAHPIKIVGLGLKSEAPKLA
jgi:hypothetical protein